MGKVKRSLVSVRLSVSTVVSEPADFDLYFCICMVHDHSSPRPKGQGHMSRSKVKVWVSMDDNAVALTSILNPSQFQHCYNSYSVPV